LFRSPPVARRPLPGKSLRVLRLGEAEHHEVAVIAAQAYVSGATEMALAKPPTLFLLPRTFLANSRRELGLR
jgi:hypothetical protein